MTDKEKEEVRLNLHAVRMEYFHKIQSPISSLLLDTDIVEKLTGRLERRLQERGYIDEDTQKELEYIRESLTNMRTLGRKIVNNNRELLHSIQDIAENLKD